MQYNRYKKSQELFQLFADLPIPSLARRNWSPRLRGDFPDESLDVSAEVHASAKMNAVQNPQHRKDKYGNAVSDRGVLECTARHPRPELFSVIPLGDTIKPGNKRGHNVVASEIVEDSTG